MSLRYVLTIFYALPKLLDGLKCESKVKTMEE